LVWGSLFGDYPIPIICETMAKKVVDVKYLENKLKVLNEQRSKVESILEQYSELYTKLSGAVETTEDMLNDITVEDKTELNKTS
jgi:hypothetical protein